MIGKKLFLYLFVIVKSRNYRLSETFGVLLTHQNISVSRIEISGAEQWGPWTGVDCQKLLSSVGDKNTFIDSIAIEIYHGKHSSWQAYSTKTQKSILICDIFV